MSEFLRRCRLLWVVIVLAALLSTTASAEADDRTAENQSGWHTERFSEIASRQLHRLADAISVHGSELVGIVDASDSGLPALVGDSFSCCPLRPKLTAVFTDDHLVVLRPRGNAVHADTFKETLADAITALREPFASTSDISVRIKVVHVDMQNNEGATTDVLYESAGKSGNRIVQQNARWRCRWLPSDPPRLASIAVEQFQEVHLQERSTPVFTDFTDGVFAADNAYRKQLAFGIDYWRARIPADLGITVTGHHGLAVADVNGDTLEDLYICQPGGLPNRLYIQNPDATVTEISAEAGLDWLDNTHAALFADLDNDGDQDLVMGTNEGLLILENDGSAHFAPRSPVTRRRPTGSPAASLAAADYDLDGDLDIYVCVYSQSPFMTGGLVRPNADGPSTLPLPYHDAVNGGRNILFRNEGQFRLVDVTADSGLGADNGRFSLAASWEDFDDDGDSDLYVANDFGRNNLYRNDSGTFVDIAGDAGVEDIGAGMSVCWGDADNDGLLDVYVSNMFSTAGNRIAFQQRFRPDSDEQTRGQFRRHARGNSLFRNTGNGTFADVSEQAGVTMGRWAWGSVFLDWNNDGREDLFVANGYLTQEDTDDL